MNPSHWHLPFLSLFIFSSMSEASTPSSALASTLSHWQLFTGLSISSTTSTSHPQSTLSPEEFPPLATDLSGT